jgi:hypothetical protein
MVGTLSHFDLKMELRQGEIKFWNLPLKRLQLILVLVLEIALILDRVNDRAYVL